MHNGHLTLQVNYTNNSFTIRDSKSENIITVSKEECDILLSYLNFIDFKNIIEDLFEKRDIDKINNLFTIKHSLFSRDSKIIVNVLLDLMKEIRNTASEYSTKIKSQIETFIQYTNNIKYLFNETRNASQPSIDLMQIKTYINLQRINKHYDELNSNLNKLNDILNDIENKIIIKSRNDNLHTPLQEKIRKTIKELSYIIMANFFKDEDNISCYSSEEESDDEAIPSDQDNNNHEEFFNSDTSLNHIESDEKPVLTANYIFEHLNKYCPDPNIILHHSFSDKIKALDKSLRGKYDNIPLHTDPKKVYHSLTKQYVILNYSLNDILEKIPCLIKFKDKITDNFFLKITDNNLKEDYCKKLSKYHTFLTKFHFSFIHKKASYITKDQCWTDLKCNLNEIFKFIQSIYDVINELEYQGVPVQKIEPINEILIYIKPFVKNTHQLSSLFYQELEILPIEQPANTENISTNDISREKHKIFTTKNTDEYVEDLELKSLLPTHSKNYRTEQANNNSDNSSPNFPIRSTLDSNIHINPTVETDQITSSACNYKPTEPLLYYWQNKISKQNLHITKPINSGFATDV